MLLMLFETENRFFCFKPDDYRISDKSLKRKTKAANPQHFSDAKLKNTQIIDILFTRKIYRHQSFSNILTNV